MKLLIFYLNKFFFPEKCPLCNLHIEQAGFCYKCYKKLEFTTHHTCHLCSKPIDKHIISQQHINDQILCNICLTQQRFFKKAMSAIIYDDISKELMLKFKYSQHLYLAQPLTDLMLLTLHSYYDDLSIIDYVIPVPQHHNKFRKRLCNPPTVLAQLIAKKIAKTLIIDVLKKNINNKIQGNMSIDKRIANVQQAYGVQNTSKILNKNILLIDDVFTTGATVNECCKVLKNNGAGNIFVLCAMITK